MEGNNQPGTAGRQPTDAKWHIRIFRIKANNNTWGAGRIAKKLYEDWPDEDAPSESVVRRILKSPPADLDMLRYYSWPSTMREGLLPWESGPALFELLRHYREAGARKPPTVGRAQWYWRVTLGCPDAPVGRRDELAGILAAADVLPEDARKATYETVEAMISYAPWRSTEDQQLYGEAIERGDISQLVLALTADTSIDAATAAFFKHTGGSVDTPFLRRAVRSFFEVMAKHPELSPPESLAESDEWQEGQMGTGPQSRSELAGGGSKEGDTQ